MSLIKPDSVAAKFIATFSAAKAAQAARTAPPVRWTGEVADLQRIAEEQSRLGRDVTAPPAHPALSPWAGIIDDFDTPEFVPAPVVSTNTIITADWDNPPWTKKFGDEILWRLFEQTGIDPYSIDAWKIGLLIWEAIPEGEVPVVERTAPRPSSPPTPAATRRAAPESPARPAPAAKPDNRGKVAKIIALPLTEEQRKMDHLYGGAVEDVVIPLDGCSLCSTVIKQADVTCPGCGANISGRTTEAGPKHVRPEDVIILGAGNARILRKGKKGFTCSECDTAVSRNADSCPGCGVDFN